MGEKTEEISQSVEQKDKMNNRKDKKLKAILAASPLNNRETREMKKEIHIKVIQENFPDLKGMGHQTKINTR